MKKINKFIKVVVVAVVVLFSASVISSCAGSTGGSGCAATQGFNL